MEVTFQIPDDLATRLTHSGDAEHAELERRALESFAADEYRQGRLHKPDLRRLFGFETSYEIDGFLKAHGVYHEMTLEDAERDLADLKACLGT